MKQFFHTGTMLIATMLVIIVAIIFSTKLMSSYDRTRVSMPTEHRPAQSQPVPASIRTEGGNSSFQNQESEWKNNSITDFSDNPEEKKKRDETHLRLTDVE